MNKRVFNALRKVAAATQSTPPSASDVQRCPTCGAVKQQPAEPRPATLNDPASTIFEGRDPLEAMRIDRERRRIDPDYDWERRKHEQERQDYIEKNIPPSRRRGIYGQLPFYR